ncbi:MAG: type II CRISPR-associated endonuclease Cas1 [Candidatus Sumerlaeaceae bacterium]|nr:type II CRISPR-associated endonuclease Cas1 [Candidatus Sumerlaeaceae bacterium]
MYRSSEKSRPPTIKRTIEISGFDASVSVRTGLVTLKREGKIVEQIPIIDLGVLIVDTPNATFTNSALVEIAVGGGLVILCGADHLPATYVLPVVGNTMQVARKLAQLQLSQRARNRVWQQLVRAKIFNQAVATPCEQTRSLLLELVKRVETGDRKNVEARAARAYWSTWLGGQPFERDRHGDPPNNLLNYGYMVLRGVVARALCAAGLDCSFGVHHVGRLAGFPLADDMMEPLRPWVDKAALELYRQGTLELTREAKARLLRVLYDPCWFENKHSTVTVATERMVGAYTRLVHGEARDIVVPKMPTDEEVWTHAEKGTSPQGEDGISTEME